MTQFKCTKCGKVFQKKGVCESCGKPLKAICPYCGFSIEYCTCEIPSTKAHMPR